MPLPTIDGIPQLILESALPTSPSSTSPAWIDLSDDLEYVKTTRGRLTEFDRIEAGTMNLRLRNDNQQYDSSNSSGPFYGYLKPVRRIRLKARYPISPNMLSADDASFETSVGLWESSGGSTWSRSNAHASDGSWSFTTTSTGAFNITAVLPGGVFGKPVRPGVQYTALASLLAGSVARNITMRIQWYGLTGTSISNSDGATLTSSTSAFTQVVVTATAPSNAYFARLVVFTGQATGAGEVVYMDKVSLAEGSSTTWQPGYSAEYPVWDGLVKSFPQIYPDRFDAIVAMECYDAFRVFSQGTVSASYSAELSGTRFTNVLNSFGWPAALRDIDAGQSMVQALTLSSSAPLAHLQDVMRSESGLFFMSKDGLVTAIDRRAMLAAAQDPALVWGDGGGSEMQYVDVEWLDTEATLWNTLSITAPGLTTQTATDSTSIDDYYTRTLPAIATLLTTTGEMSDLGQFKLARYKQPAKRISKLLLDGQPATQWPYILARELGDKILVKGRPPGGGDTISQNSVIEGIELEATAPDDIEVRFALSNVSGSLNYMLLDDAINGQFDSNAFGY